MTPKQQAMFDEGERIGIELNGTAQHLRDVATPEQIDNRHFCDGLDGVTFECMECGWWNTPDEDAGEGVCWDCVAGEQEQDEDEDEDEDQ